MDPKACLLAALAAFLDDDPDAFEEHMRAYSDWRQKDGFEPVGVIDGDALHNLLLDVTWRGE